MTKFPVWVWASACLVFVLASFGTVLRHKAESLNKAVSVIIEADTVRQLAAAEGVRLPKALEDLKAKGASGISLNEQTASDLITSGAVSVTNIDSDSCWLYGDKRAIDRITAAYAALYGAPEEKRLGLAVFDPNLLRSLPIGIDPDFSKAAQAAKLDIVARLSNPIGSSERWMEWSLSTANDSGASYYLPLGDQVLGDRELVKTTTGVLERLGIFYAGAEFVKTSGESKVLDAVPQLSLRLHSAQVAELQKMTEAAMVERYVKAARERNIRLLLVRPAGIAGSKPFTNFTGQVALIAKALAQDGLTVRKARPFTDPAVPMALRLAIGISCVPVFAFALFSVFPLLSRYHLAWVLAAGAGLLAFSSKYGEYTALAATLAFPVVGLIWMLGNENRSPVLQYLGISAMSLIGGLVPAVMLTGLGYMLQADQFTGVKLSVFGPILIGSWLIVNKVRPLREIGQSPVLWGTLAASILTLAALAFMNSRTGNDNPAGVSGAELQMRDLLDRILLVRPRTKEFMIGHPAMVVGLAIGAFAASRPSLRPWWAALVAVGLVGQTSVVNTLCHAHTPVALSLARIVTGHVAGCILGLVVWAVLKPILAKRTQGAV